MYTYKEKYTLDFSNVKDYFDMHRIIKDELDFPDYYGENWSAFWDCLTDMITVGKPLFFELIGVEALEQKNSDDLKKMIEILKRLKHWHSDKYCNCVKVEIVLGEARYEIS
jgi:RNAse (barnase) inhibitor barstar